MDVCYKWKIGISVKVNFDQNTFNLMYWVSIITHSHTKRKNKIETYMQFSTDPKFRLALAAPVFRLLL